MLQVFISPFFCLYLFRCVFLYAVYICDVYVLFFFVSRMYHTVAAQMVMFFFLVGFQMPLNPLEWIFYRWLLHCMHCYFTESLWCLWLVNLQLVIKTQRQETKTNSIHWHLSWWENICYSEMFLSLFSLHSCIKNHKRKIFIEIVLLPICLCSLFTAERPTESTQFHKSISTKCRRNWLFFLEKKKT